MALVIKGGAVDPLRLAKPIKDNIVAARQHRKQFEPGWEMNIAFASGKHFLVYDRYARTLRRIQDVDPRYKGKELHTSDLVNEYRTTALGELGSDDDRPELLTINEDIATEDFKVQLNRAVAYGWDNEWDGDGIMAEIDRLCVDLGTAAIRCRFDPGSGPVIGEYPHMGGMPVPSHQVDELMSQFQQGPVPGVEMRPVNSGKITWEPCSPFNLLVPPGVAHERNFPYDCIVRAVPLSKVKALFGSAADNLRADGDIKSTLGIAQQGSGSGFTAAVGDTNTTRLKDHVWVYTYYERPTPNFPQGRTFHFGGNQLEFLGYEESLPYCDSGGEYCSGIVYFHWWRVTGRFWSRSLVSSLQDAQFMLDKRLTQNNEIIDRSMPYVFIERGSSAVKRTFLPFEEIELDKNERQPLPVQGTGPGQWMYQDIELIRENAGHASGIKSSALGENPANVTTYSQLALIKENDAIKRQPTQFERKQGIGKAIEFSVYDIRKYWGREKHILIAGEEGQVEEFVFDSTKIPAQFKVKVARGTPKPRTQAAELQKIQDIAQYSLNSQQPLSVRWYYESIQNGQPMPLPDEPSNDQYDKALLENHIMLQGGDVPPAYYDPIEIHIPLHRKAQIQAELTGDTMSWQRIEAHIKAHEIQAQQNAAQLASQTGPPSLVGPDGQANPQAMGQVQQSVQAGSDQANQNVQQLIQAASQQQQQEAAAQQQQGNQNNGSQKTQ